MRGFYCCVYLLDHLTIYVHLSFFKVTFHFSIMYVLQPIPLNNMLSMHNSSHHNICYYYWRANTLGNI